jgi:hypothetical protein
MRYLIVLLTLLPIHALARELSIEDRACITAAAAKLPPVAALKIEDSLVVSQPPAQGQRNASDGSKPLENNLHERYARLRAAALPRIVAFRKAGSTAKNDHVADANSFRLERKPGVRERIEYLARQAEERIAEKRRRIEEKLWAIHEANIGDFFETVDIDGKIVERPKRLSDLSPEISKNIEKIAISANGRLVPQLYSKLAASQELRKMLNIGGQKDRPETDGSRLSDAELVRQLADQAKQLGVEIDLSYSFAQQSDE